jgi:hemerythrin superfamily protein
MPAKKDEPTNAVALLKADHRKVEDLFEQFEKASRTDHKEKLAIQICTELTIHATIEEEIFYPACQGEVEDRKMDEAYVEHDGAKVLIAEIEAAEADADFYDAKVKVLSEMIKHHVKEEEAPSDGVFAQAKSAGLNLDELGERLVARKAELKAQIEAEGLPTLETRTYTGHELKQGEPVEA